MEARKCASGGFVPTKWYVARFDVDDFRRTYPDYNHETVLKPNRPMVSLGCFRIQPLDDREGTACLDELKTVIALATPGGEIPLRVHPPTLTLTNIKAIAGGKLAAKK
jgi:hypothetical protein